MARTDTLKNFLTDIANKFRKKLGTSSKIAHAEFDTKIDEVYEAGRNAEWDYFWTVYQCKGQRTRYRLAFTEFWDENTFIPKYKLKPIDACQMFYLCFIGRIDKESDYDKEASLIKLLDKAGVKLDTSAATDMRYMFAYSWITEVPTIDLRSAGSNTQHLFFSAYRLRRIEKLIVSVDTNYKGMFNKLTTLESIQFEGVIDSDISFETCTKLNMDSLFNIVEHLSDTNGRTLVLSAKAVDSAFKGIDPDISNPDWVHPADHFNELCLIKSDWTISFV